MSTEKSRLLDNVDDALKSVAREMAKARQQKEGTRIEAVHVAEAKLKLQVALRIMEAIPLCNLDSGV